jgi:acyl carrier protein
MYEIETMINSTIVDILRQKNVVIESVDPTSKLIEDLGFSSLDLAELVAVIHLKCGLDPFATRVAVTSIQSVSELYEAYSYSDNP